MFGGIISNQGERINHIKETLEEVVEDTNIALNNIEKTDEYIRKKLQRIRNIVLIAAGGLVGVPGLLLGPIFGALTITAGMSAGGLTAYGIKKLKKE